MFKIRCWVTWLSGEGCSRLLRPCLDATSLEEKSAVS